MLKGLVITPPTLGRISIGKVIERNGQRLPQKDDQFTITSQIQGKEGWLLHPLDALLKTQQNNKIRRIPIRLLFNDPQLNFRAEYTLFDKATGKPLCKGDGQTCQRTLRTTDKVNATGEASKSSEVSQLQTLPCPSPDQCALAITGQTKVCKPYGRLNVLIDFEEDKSEDQTQETDHTLKDMLSDELGSFIFRTTGYNSIRTLTARLQYFDAVSKGLLSCLPLDLKLRGKSTRQSHGTAIYYVDITIRQGLSLEEALSQAQTLHQQRQAAGLDQAALDAAARLGFGSGMFEESEEEVAEVVQEFYASSDEALSSV